MKVIGIDDAGRGPLIGPMILAGVMLTEEQEKLLKKEGISDSKILSHPVRIKMSKLIKKKSLSYKIVKTIPEEIDNHSNLNTLEAEKAAEIINYLNKGDKIKVIVDCPSVNTKVWSSTLRSLINETENINLICEHKADANHASVSAASILAKVTREEEVEKLKKEYGDFGSGYPSDPKTKLFLKQKGAVLKDSGIFRKSWATWKAVFPSKSQSTLF